LFSSYEPPPTVVYPLSLHDALPILLDRLERGGYPRHHALPTATLGFAVGLFALAAAPALAVAIAAMAFSGAFWIWMYAATNTSRSEEHTSELQSLRHLVCRLLLEKK